MGVFRCAWTKMTILNCSISLGPTSPITRAINRNNTVLVQRWITNHGWSNQSRLPLIAKGLQARNRSEIVRGGGSSDTVADNTKLRRLESLGQRFQDALELLEDAKSSVGTVYFSADMKEAEEFVEDTLASFRQMLSELNDEQKQTVGRTATIKMEELKAQLDILKSTVTSNV